MIRTCLAIAVLLACAAPAAADAIDGEWCSAKGLHLTINRSEITTPGGAVMQGNYSRHAFAYVAPPSEPDAGAQILMELQSEELMRRYQVKNGIIGEGEEWRRCQVTS